MKPTAPPEPDVIHPLVEECVAEEIAARLHFLDAKAATASHPDGLSRKDKELLSMSIANAHAFASAAQLHARAAIRAGATIAEVVEVGVLAIICRGMPGFKMSALPAILAAEKECGEEYKYPVDGQEQLLDIRAYIAEALGITLPDMWLKLETVAPYALNGYMMIRQGLLKDGGALPKSIKELVIIAMDISYALTWGSRMHARQAVRDGATVRQMAEIVALAMMAGGHAVYHTGGAGVMQVAEEEAAARG
ncbi:carboxymuconolactone decarboxylase family protein [Ramlibacter sp.]|uniref:carboxymuconolactone decarboxylase family protein n=1 Tax=Ramlibacter sp. TaxID=1917967 RepID=UPI003D14BA5F